MKLSRIVVPLVLLLVAVGCGPAGAEGNEAPAAPRSASSATAIRVEVAVLGESDATIDLMLPGEIEGSRDATLSAALGGYVEAVRVSPGDRVRKGQVVARIDADLHAAGLAGAEAQVDLATAALGRLELLGDLATAQQLENAAIQVRIAKAGADQARTRLARAIVTAPFAGTVAQVAVDPGEVAAPGAPIARLVRLDPIKVTLSVTDRDMVSLREGMPVQVTTAARAGIFSGRIEHISAAAHPSTRAFEVQALVPNPDGALLPGMIARVRASRTLDGGRLVIPQDWIVTGLEGQGVFVEQGGVASWRPVTLGEIVRDQVVVDSGLESGDRIVITGHRELVDGDPLLISREGVCCTGGRAVFAGG